MYCVLLFTYSISVYVVYGVIQLSNDLPRVTTVKCCRSEYSN